MSRSHKKEKENSPPPERNSRACHIHSTPFGKFVTLRRKAAAPEVIMKPQGSKSKRGEISKQLSLLSSDSCDFEASRLSRRNKKRLCADVSDILDSSADALHSPLQKTPLLSSTPAVLLSAMPRRGNTFVRQLALFDPHEESVVRCFAEPDCPCPAETKKGSDLPSRMARLRSLMIMSDRKRKPSSVLPCNSIVNKDLSCTLGFRSSTEQSVRGTGHLSGSGVKCVRLLSAHMESQSVICIDDAPLKHGPQAQDNVFCVSSDLFSTPEKSDPLINMESPDFTQQGLSDSPSAGYTLQPVIKLNAKTVTEYFENKKINTQHLANVKEPHEALEVQPSTTGNVDMTDLGLSTMQPVVCLDPTSVTRYFLKSGVSEEHASCTETNDDFLALQRLSRTPLISGSVARSNMHKSVPTQDTGRKVCISGFSAKRWGKCKKKSSKAKQHLSFQNSDFSVLKFKEDVSGALSASLLFSTSLLTTSFMNSSAIRDLNLSTESLTAPDPQKDQQRWARLRAALSLHRKKKVEAGHLCSCSADRKNVKTVVNGQNSSMLLLSPSLSSLYVDELSDAGKVFLECQQEKPITFYECLEQLQQCQKVGEGVYGEVFRTMREDNHVALKVIPIEGSQKINGEHQKRFAEILPEIIISKELSLLSGGEENRTSGFIKLHSAHCVQGSYPKELLSAWDRFAKEKGTENERPDLFRDDQLFMILEFEFGGDDLERMSTKIPSVVVSRSILHQVTAALAVAEEELRFEHRDLHWGNLLIEQTESQMLSVSVHRDTFDIPTAGVQVKIIDYTLSRLDKDGLTVFCDLSMDQELFLGEGDLQFDVYRNMRQENENTWSLYRPHSNVLWLHYLCDKLLAHVQYVKKPRSVSHRRELRKLQDFRREMRQFSSAADVLRRSKLFQ